MNAADMRAALLGMNGDCPVVHVKTPEWTAYGLPEVYHLTPGSDDRDWYDGRDTELRYPRDEHGQLKPGDLRGLRAGMVARLLCDVEGNLCGFEPNEVLELRRRNGAAMDRIFYSIQQTGGMLPTAVADAEKNSEAGQEAG